MPCIETNASHNPRTIQRPSTLSNSNCPRKQGPCTHWQGYISPGAIHPHVYVAVVLVFRPTLMMLSRLKWFTSNRRHQILVLYPFVLLFFPCRGEYTYLILPSIFRSIQGKPWIQKRDGWRRSVKRAAGELKLYKYHLICQFEADAKSTSQQP